MQEYDLQLTGEQVDARLNKVPGNENRITTLENSVSAHGNTLSAHGTRLGNLETATAQHNESITGNTAAIGALQADVRGLSSNLAALQVAHQAWEGRVIKPTWAQATAGVGRDGEYWYNTLNNRLYRSNGTAYVQVTEGVYLLYRTGHGLYLHDAAGPELHLLVETT